MERRLFLQITGMGLAGGILSPERLFSEDSVNPAGTATSCILIKLLGAPSHVDTFDLKEGAWTPADFDIRDCGNFRLSQKLFPNLCRLAPSLSLVRSLRSWGVEHNQAQYALVAGRQFNPGFVQEIPHIGSVVALEFSQRGDTGIFPPFVSFNTSSEIDAGFLAARYGSRNNPFITYPATPEISHPEGAERFAVRWELLGKLDRSSRRIDTPRGQPFGVYDGVYLQAKDLSNYQPFEEAFSLREDERKRYGSSLLGDACIVSLKLISASRGTRFIVINHSGDASPQAWDTHANVYGESNLPALARELDRALGALIDDMQRTPAVAGQPGSAPTLFDKTLIVVAGEFGRTAGSLNPSLGRDHHPVFSALFAGGGVRGNRAIGTTDSIGEQIVDSGWRDGRRPTRIEDISATLYSALGINWTKTILDTPSGRPFSYTAYSPEGEHSPLPLFT